MLRPIESSTRELKSLDGLWRFNVPPTLESAESPRSAAQSSHEPWKSVLPDHLQCPVPASYNDIFVPDLRDHVGVVWYQRMVRIPRLWLDHDRRVLLRFDAVTHRGDVYVDDELVATHIGGYTPFEVDITDRIKEAEEFRLTVSVDNVLTNVTVPPGRLLTNSYGVVQQKYWHDFFNYSGIHRSVYLVSRPAVAIQDVTITTDIRGTTGIVQYDLEVAGDDEKANKTVTVELIDEDSKSVAQGTGAKGKLEIPDAQLWQPGKAYLYTFHARILSSSGTISDDYYLSVGIRTIRIEGTEFLINGKPFYFKGYGKHEDTLIRGKGRDLVMDVHDFELMRWTGANSFRTSHYPYAEEIYDYADRHGWVVIDETPAVGLNLAIGGGMFTNGGETFGPNFANEETQAAHAKVLEELVQRDKNHPSVVMWCITNEPDSSEKGARAYFEPLVHLTRRLDPTRPVTFTNLVLVSAENDRIADLFDVISLNRYYGWYESHGDLVSAEKSLERELLDWQEKYKRPMLMLEYGVDTIDGMHSLGKTPYTEEYQAEYYDMYHRVFDRIEALKGEQVWNFADFSTGHAIFRVIGNRKGIFTRDRKPKMAAHVLRKRWTQKDRK